MFNLPIHKVKYNKEQAEGIARIFDTLGATAIAASAASVDTGHIGKGIFLLVFAFFSIGLGFNIRKLIDAL